MSRIAEISSYLSPCKVFADVGCDHGYLTEYMLSNSLCERAIITDISAKSLNKAEVLLKKYIDDGKCYSVCCDGISAVKDRIDEVLIAGMGGEEIIKIFKDAYIPESFVLQPMKNAELVRKYLIENGCSIERDDVFYDGKYYFIMSGKNSGGTKNYTESELAFGRDSLKNEVLLGLLDEEIAKNNLYLKNDMSEENRNIVLKRLNFLNGVKKNASSRPL